MPVAEFWKVNNASQAGLSGYALEIGAASTALAALPGLVSYMDPDGPSTVSPPVEERISGVAPTPGEATSGGISTTVTAQNFANKRVFNFLLNVSRGKIFYKVPSTRDLTFIGALQPGPNTLNGAKNAGIAWITDSQLVIRRWLQIGGNPAAVLMSSGNTDGTLTNAAGLASLTTLAAGKTSIVVAVWSSTRGLMEFYCDGLTTPLFSVAMPVVSVTTDGQLELGGFGGDAVAWKGLIGRCAVAGADLLLPANKPILQSAVNALASYYAGTGT